jgi:hypothetical protein
MGKVKPVEKAKIVKYPQRILPFQKYWDVPGLASPYSFGKNNKKTQTT